MNEVEFYAYKCMLKIFEKYLQSSKDSTSPMSETCEIRTGQVKFQDRKPNWACKIVDSKLTKYGKTNQNSFLKMLTGADMQILLIRDTNGSHCRRYGKLIILKFPNRPCFGKKKSSGLCNFFQASKFCLLSALWACDEKNFFRRLYLWCCN